MKKYLKKLFDRFGYTITNKKMEQYQSRLHGETMRDTLQRLNELKIIPSTVVDVGAAEGTWTEKTLNIWPDAKYLLFEPLEERKGVLNELRTKFPSNIFLAFAAAGSAASTVNFYITSDLDGSGVDSGGATHNNIRTVNVVSIDSEVAKNNLPKPYLVKLDTHGFEVPILEGSKQVLQESVCIIVECYGFNITPTSLVFWEMCEYLSKLNFRLFDMVEIMRRPQDAAFWQCDAIFIKADHPLYSNNSYV